MQCAGQGSTHNVQPQASLSLVYATNYTSQDPHKLMRLKKQVRLREAP